MCLRVCVRFCVTVRVCVLSMTFHSPYLQDEGGEEALDMIFNGHLSLSRYGFTPDDILLLDGDFDLPDAILQAMEANS